MPEFVAVLLSLATLAVQAAGVIFAVRAVLISRTPQAAIAWAFALIVLPILTIPLFLIFGESRFSGYTMAGAGQDAGLDAALRRIQAALQPFAARLPAKYADTELLATQLCGLPPTRGNSCRLLVDGEETFSSILQAIAAARDYVVVQFYIVHDDELGRALKGHLLDAARRGVQCWLLYDTVGSKGLPETYVNDLKAGGVRVQGFVTNRQFGRRFQINFRNHRKLVIVDGHTAFLGGLNAGDEYLGKGPLGPWRDTHMAVSGPAVQALQLSFLEDWFYVDKTVPDLPCAPRVSGEQIVLPFASGPSESWNITPAVFCEIIHDVRKRLWIASPYFVPDPALRTAIGHAALRGVDVRIILPQGIDHLLPWLSSHTYYPAMEEAGVKIWRYQPGFMHQKVLLADDDLAIVGSVNLDFRSFMLNFELSGLVQDRAFAAEVEKMFEADFARSRPEDLHMFAEGSFFFRLKCRLAALMSPEQ
jgi:cardiolipin synthase A/B